MRKSSKQELVSIIIPNYNERYLLFNCITSLTKQDYKKIEIIVVDNGSMDESTNFIKSKYPKVKIIQNKTNLGFGKANNEGIKIAKGKYILFLNNDTELFKNTITKMVTFLKNNESSGIAFPNEITRIGKETHISTGGIVFELNGFQFTATSKNNHYFEPNGSCFLIKNLKQPIFDEDYFLFGEEHYTGFNQNIIGKKVSLVKDAYFTHLKKATVRKMNPFRIALNVEKNSLTNFFTTWETKSLLFLTPLLIFDLLLSYTYLFLSLKWSYLLGKLFGCIKFIFSLKKVLVKRNSLQKNRVVFDKEILSIFINSKNSVRFRKLKMRDKIFDIYKKYVALFN